MGMKEEFFRKIEERKEEEDNEVAYWDYIYSLINDYTPEKVEDFLERYPLGKVTEKEIERHKAYCVFEKIDYKEMLWN